MEEYLEASELKDPGYYWWLPECSRNESHDPTCWQPRYFHPLDPSTPRSGLFYGPVPAPVFPVGQNPKIITFFKLANEAGIILNSGQDWKDIYDQIFCDEIAERIERTGIKLENYSDPDTSYEEDCRAYVRAITEQAQELRRNFNSCQEEP